MKHKCFYCGEKEKGHYETDGLGNQYFCCENCEEITYRLNEVVK